MKYYITKLMIKKSIYIFPMIILLSIITKDIIILLLPLSIYCMYLFQAFIIEYTCNSFSKKNKDN